MSRGKYLSLSEARKKGQLDRFAKEHPAIGDRRGGSATTAQVVYSSCFLSARFSRLSAF